MLEVVTMQQASEAIDSAFGHLRTSAREVGLDAACGLVLARDIVAPEGIPPFDRSTVDGYALHASDTFGCSEALPALLHRAGSILMGEPATQPCDPGTCWAIPTGGEVPAGADAVVMVEHTEDFGDGTIGILSSVAPGTNLIYRHDDVAPGHTLCHAGQALAAHHVGALASLGITRVQALAPVRVGILSTGDEIVPADATPQGAQMRDVNGPLLASAVRACGGEGVHLGIVPDEADALEAAVAEACSTCDVVLVSGGSSVGQRDATSTVFGKLGTILLHGIAMKPGKPTLVTRLGDTPAFGLPGHPLAAYFVFLEFVRPLLLAMQGIAEGGVPTRAASLTQAVPSNHGRAECVAVHVEEGPEGLRATPVRSKSGLMSLLSQASGYIVVPRDTEGLAIGTPVQVKPF